LDKIQSEDMLKREIKSKAFFPSANVTSLQLRIRQLESTLKQAEMARNTLPSPLNADQQGV
jgi:hypothetical protein